MAATQRAVHLRALAVCAVICSLAVVVASDESLDVVELGLDLFSTPSDDVVTGDLARLQVDSFIQEGMPEPLTLAKQACQAAWAETQKQTTLIIAATAVTDGMLALKGVIRGAGLAVQAEVQKVIDTATHAPTAAPTAAYASGTGSSGSAAPATPAPASEEVRRIRKVLTSFDRLGESDNDTDETSNLEMMKTLGHMAGQSMWVGVEQLCDKVDKNAEQGQDAVKGAAKDQGADFVSRTSTVAETQLAPAPAPAAGAPAPAAGAPPPAPAPAPAYASSSSSSSSGAGAAPAPAPIEYEEDAFVKTLNGDRAEYQ